MASTAAINSFPGTVYISARSIATDIDHIAHAFVSAFLPATLNASGQNMGAKQPKRVKRILAFSLAQAVVVVSIVSGLMLLFLDNISAMFVSASYPLYAEKLEAVSTWCSIMLPAQIIAAILNVSIGCVRGLGYSVIPLVINLVGTIGIRLAWIYGLFFAFEELHTFRFLALMYPISNGTTALAGLILAIIAIMRLNKKLALEEETGGTADDDRDGENASPGAEHSEKVAAGS
jgi:Na+-driven multidrug efflux pump